MAQTKNEILSDIDALLSRHRNRPRPRPLDDDLIAHIAAREQQQNDKQLRAPTTISQNVDKAKLGEIFAFFDSRARRKAPLPLDHYIAKTQIRNAKTLIVKAEKFLGSLPETSQNVHQDVSRESESPRKQPQQSEFKVPFPPKPCQSNSKHVAAAPLVPPPSSSLPTLPTTPKASVAPSIPSLPFKPPTVASLPLPPRLNTLNTPLPPRLEDPVVNSVPTVDKSTDIVPEIGEISDEDDDEDNHQEEESPSPIITPPSQPVIPKAEILRKINEILHKSRKRPRLEDLDSVLLKHVTDNQQKKRGRVITLPSALDASQRKGSTTRNFNQTLSHCRSSLSNLSQTIPSFEKCEIRTQKKRTQRMKVQKARPLRVVKTMQAKLQSVSKNVNSGARSIVISPQPKKTPLKPVNISKKPPPQQSTSQPLRPSTAVNTTSLTKLNWRARIHAFKENRAKMEAVATKKALEVKQKELAKESKNRMAKLRKAAARAVNSTKITLSDLDEESGYGSCSRGIPSPMSTNDYSVTYSSPGTPSDFSSAPSPASSVYQQSIPVQEWQSRILPPNSCSTPKHLPDFGEEDSAWEDFLDNGFEDEIETPELDEFFAKL